MNDTWRVWFFLLLLIPFSMAMGVGYLAAGVWGAIASFVLCWVYVGALIALVSGMPSIKVILLWAFVLWSDRVRDYALGLNSKESP